MRQVKSIFFQMSSEISSTQASNSARILPQKENTHFFNRLTSVVLALIGMAFLASGSYLLLSGTGTIPAHTSGVALMIGGATLLLSTFSRLFRAH